MVVAHGSVPVPLVMVRQHAVGHGGFHVGAAGFNAPPLRWVYDCGSWRKAGKTALREATASFAAWVKAGGQPLDILFLSHFDADHVSGLKDLLAGLEGVGVDTVVLPYLSPADAFGVLMQALATGHWTSDLNELCLDPEGWLGARGVRRVVQIAPDDGDAGPPVLGEPVAPEPDPEVLDLGGATLKPVLVDADGTVRRDAREPPSGRRGPATVVPAKTGAHLRSEIAGRQADWVFVPYVHPVSVITSDRVRRRAEALVGCSVRAPGFARKVSNFLRKATKRKTLRAIYQEREFGDANAISMSLYVGPRHPSTRTFVDYWSLGPEVQHPTSAGWLLTGDAKLANRGRRERWRDFFRNLAPVIGTMMLPHHGAAGNFHADILDVAPSALLFVTAEGGDLLHPHEDVLDELAGIGRNVFTVSSDEGDELMQWSGDRDWHRYGYGWPPWQ